MNRNYRTLEGPLSGKSGHTIHGKSNHKRQEMSGYTNQSFSSLPEDFRIHGVTDIESSNSSRELMFNQSCGDLLVFLSNSSRPYAAWYFMIV